MGKAFVYGDDVNTDVLAPGHYMKFSPEILASHCLEAIDPGFATTVRPGDMVVGGRSFGMGSSREQAAVSLKLLGVAAVIAVSFGRIFYRNAINLGLPAIVLAEAGEIAGGDEVRVDVEAGVVENPTSGRSYAVAAMTPHLMNVIRAGGLLSYTRQRLAAATSHP